MTVVAASASDRRDELARVYRDAATCERCPQLAQTRRNVVFGAGNADADLMFIGEAPGQSEDEQGLPFVGRAGKLLDELLTEIGLARGDVFITNVLMCRPPANRDPHPNEIDRCQDWLRRKVELVRPSLVCTLGNFATKLLREDQTGITRLHGQPEERRLGSLNVRLLPLFHPAAALYTPSNVELLREDFRQIPSLLGLPPLEQPPARVEAPEADEAREGSSLPAGRSGDAQLGLF